MTAKLHHTALPIDAVTATTAATGYPAIAITIPGVGRPWRSTSTASNNLDIDLGTTRTAPVICLQGPNAGTCTLSYGSAAYTTTSAGTQTLSRDRHGRRKHSLALAGSVRFIRLVFGATLPDDAADYFELGAVYVFSSTLALPEEALFGSEARARWPQTRIELPNGNELLFERGVPRQHLTMRFRSLRTTDAEELARRARRAPCWLDMDVSANRELQWPVRMIEPEIGRSFVRPLQDETTIPLAEIA